MKALVDTHFKYCENNVHQCQNGQSTSVLRAEDGWLPGGPRARGWPVCEGRCPSPLQPQLSLSHIPSVATRHRALPGSIGDSASCTWQHNPLINLEGPPLVHTLLKHLLLILSILTLSSIPMNQRALSVAMWAIFWRPCIFSYQLLTLQCIGFDNLAGMVSNNVYNSKQ